MEETLILNQQRVNQKLKRIAYQIVEHHYAEEEVILIGVKERGWLVAQNLMNIIETLDTSISFNLQWVQMDKDDFNKFSTSQSLSQIAKQKAVVVIDDVLNSGKTLMYAVKHILDLEVKRMCTAVLVDRRHRTFPIKADFAGLTLSTTLQEHIEVRFEDENAMVYLK